MAKLRIGTLERLKVIESSLGSRINRVRKRSFAIVQASLAAGLAYWVAQTIFGHASPFFAPITVVIILGLSGGDRIRRAAEISLGVTVGVGLGDFLVNYVGPGTWQISVIVAVSLLVASMLSSSVLVSNQVAIGAIIIATIMPPGTAGGGTERMFDAFIGSVIGLVTIALLPASPLNSGRREVSKLLGIASSVLDDVAVALEKQEVKELDEAIMAVHNTQAGIADMIAAAKGGREVSKLSPMMWDSRWRVRSLERILPSVEQLLGDIRVLARRARVLCEDGDQVTIRLINIIDELADITASLSDYFDGLADETQTAEIPALVRRLQVLAASTDMSVVKDDGVLSEYVLLAQARSVTVHLLVVCGWSEESATAALPPTSATPAYPYERWPGIIEDD
ncbi:FUSC family protein [Corynebacterium alimapuense]|uniref:Integral membrane bound transporter domain-containing protein n=1 Tax=Corynebacterium alimapuense TaxID=1576874 RepID=A0A3M8KC12_9CORY|nr:FUSC family protein [Corynebacterium alimapuense]RNE49928.1 hypothetical protein C5L39_00705 [Corynebacterium alimapuense]